MTSTELRAIRKRFGLTQSAWGFLLGLGREHIAKLEAGTKPVSKPVAILVEMYKRHGIG